VTSLETTAPIGRIAYRADAGRQVDQLARLLAWENGQREYMRVDRDPDVLEQLTDGGYVAWGVQSGYYLTDRGRGTVLKLATLDAHAEHDRREAERTEVIADVEQTEIIPAEPPIEATLPGRHRIVKARRTPGWLMVAWLMVLDAVDRLLTRVAYRIARFATVHARGLAWFVVATPALAAGLVLGTTGVLWVIR
jgi:hypothetical protein